MLVHQILSAKASTGTIVIASTETVEAALHLLAEKKIGAVVVSDDGVTPLGILSERDVVREIAHAGVGRLQAPVAELMTRKLVSCGTQDSADDVMVKMTGGRFRHMPVLEDGKMLGLISIGDVVKARLSELSMEKEALQGMIMGY